MATSRKPEVDGAAAIFIVLTWSTACLRCYVKGFIMKHFGLEDCLALLAVILFTFAAVFAAKGIAHSMGEHLIDIPRQNLEPAMKYYFATNGAYVLTTCVVKLSIGIFLLRIVTRRLHRAMLFTTMAIASLTSLSFFCFLTFQCKPVSYFWEKFSGMQGKCLGLEVTGRIIYVHSGINALADIVLTVLPIRIISQLQMNIRTKVSVSSIMSLGILACIAVLIRIPYVKILVNNQHDFFYYSTDVVIWSAIEAGLAITAANIATLRPLFVKFSSRSRIFGESASKKNSQRYVSSRSKSTLGDNASPKVAGDQVTLTESDTKGGGSSVHVEEENGVESGNGSERTGAVGREERLQNDVTLGSDADAQEGHRRKPSLGIIKTVRWEVVSKPAT